MKRIGIVVLALAALLVLPGAAKADSFTGASGTVLWGGSPLTGSGVFSGSSEGPGSVSFSFTNLGIFNTITIGSGADKFIGAFTSGFTQTGTCSVGLFCQIVTANVASVNGSGYVGTGTITLETALVNGQWVIVNGSASIGTSSVPEPGTLGMFAIGLAGIGLMVSRKAKALQATA